MNSSSDSIVSHSIVFKFLKIFMQILMEILKAELNITKADYQPAWRLSNVNFTDEMKLVEASQ